MKRRTLKSAFVVFLLLIAGVILVRIYWADISTTLGQILEILSKTRIHYFILSFLVYMLILYLFAVRWQQILCAFGYDLKANSLFPVILGGIFVNNLTPASRSGGEPLRMYWVNKKFGISFTNSLMSIVFERLVEVVPIFILLIYIVYSIPSFRVEFMSVGDSLSLNSIYLLLFCLFSAAIAIWLLRARLSNILKTVEKSWKKLHKSFTAALLLSSGAWILDLVRLKLLALALNLSIPLNVLATISFVYLLLGSLPITPGGLGIVEGGLISVLVYFGLTLAPASSFVFLERLISFGLSSVIGFLCLFYYGGYELLKSARLD